MRCFLGRHEWTEESQGVRYCERCLRTEHRDGWTYSEELTLARMQIAYYQGRRRK